MHALLLTKLWLAISAVTAQSQDPSPISSAPTCAQESLLGGLVSSNCDYTNPSCICSNSTFLTSLTQTIQSDCDALDQEAVASITSQWCPADPVIASFARAASSLVSSSISASTSSASSSPNTTTPAGYADASATAIIPLASSAASTASTNSTSPQSISPISISGPTTSSASSSAASSRTSSATNSTLTEVGASPTPTTTKDQGPGHGGIVYDTSSLPPMSTDTATQQTVTSVQYVSSGPTTATATTTGTGNEPAAGTATGINGAGSGATLVNSGSSIFSRNGLSSWVGLLLLSVVLGFGC